MLKVLLTKEEHEELPEAIKEHYGEDSDGNFILDQDDTTYKATLGEFRNNNIKLKKEQDKLAVKMKEFDGVDPVKYKEYKDKMQKLEEKELIDANDIDGLVAQRTVAMKADLDGKITKLEELNLGLTEDAKVSKHELAKVVIDSAVQTSVTKVGTVRKGAMTDILARARTVFQLEDGVPVPKGADGKVLYGNDGKDPLKITEWTESLVKDAPYLFEGSSGSGSGGNENEDGKGGKIVNGEVPAGDKTAFGKNLEDIASGKVKVAASA